MKIGRKITNYDMTLTDKDIEILIECIQKCKLDNFRHTNHAESLLEGFVGIFLDENYDKYVNRYLELVGIYLEHNHKVEDGKIEKLLNKTREEIEDDKNYVFHYDPEDWSKKLFETECNNIEDMPKRLRFRKIDEYDNDNDDKIE